MVQAVGVLRDRRAAPVLALAFDNATSPPVAQAAGEALGRLCDDPSFERLRAAAAVPGAKQTAAIHGLGWCRREAAAAQLAELLASAQTEPLAAVVAQSLGIIGSSWGWRAMGPERAAEGLAVREVAAQALVPAYLRWRGAARKAIRIGLTMVEYADLRALVVRYQPQADDATAVELDRIVERVERRQRR